jgi:mannose-6-phosphate isomerase-like protein (cupin superfamily)
MSKYIKQTNPFVVPTNDGKTIREHFGLASIHDGDYSVAHMIAPPGWSEPPQTPEFDEITFVFRGQKQILIDDTKTVVLGAGESLLTKAGTKIQYANPYDQECEYLSICMPAFSMDKVNREG